ncbi:MAG: hypothetical protein GX359_03120 [Clostridiales bacterium]|nr:hypothetical protein [Clostridiales bacterium]
MKAEASEIDIEFKGAGNIELEGATDKISIFVKGAADIDAYEMIAEDAEVEVNGTALCKVYASENLTATLKGVGAIKYDGDPKNINKIINGLGTISKK